MVDKKTKCKKNKNCLRTFSANIAHPILDACVGKYYYIFHIIVIVIILGLLIFSNNILVLLFALIAVTLETGLMVVNEGYPQTILENSRESIRTSKNSNGCAIKRDKQMDSSIYSSVKVELSVNIWFFLAFKMLYIMSKKTFFII